MNYLQSLNIPSDLLYKVLTSVLVLIVLWVVHRVACSIARKKVSDLARFYHLRRIIDYTFWTLLIVVIGANWIKGIQSLATILGLASAGLAIAMHDTIANIAGWIYILGRKPFQVGERIEVGKIKGDVIDIRMFQFSLIEIGNWVDADQSSGRIIHVPNSMALREAIANYETGFEYIWHELPVLITFESDWKKAKKLLIDIAREKAEHLSTGAEEQIRKAAMKYLIHYNKLTPIVYVSVRDSGVLLTVRYIVKPRSRRGSENDLWEAILEAFEAEANINLAYPTTRFYEENVTASLKHPPRDENK